MFTKTQPGSISYLLAATLAALLLLPACSPAVPPATPASPTATVLSGPGALPHFSMDTGSMATGFQTETVAAVSESSGAPFWEVLPEYTRVTLQGYPLNNRMQAQIFIYPIKDLGNVNEGAGKIAASLQTLLQSHQEIQTMPFLPLYNAAQAMHAQVSYLDFKNGRGLRYLTEFNQGIEPTNNAELLYTYQGLTSDGKFYVAAVLPANHPSLPADGKITGNEPPEFTSDFPTYLTNVAKSLNSQAAGTYAPDLTQLDAMLNSLEIK
jgi:hypothetical protein